MSLSKKAVSTIAIDMKNTPKTSKFR